MPTGLEDLLRRMDGERLEVALLLVKAPLGAVVSGLADTYGTAPLIEDAPVRIASEDAVPQETTGWIAAVEQRDEPWVCVYVALGDLVELERDLVLQVAADLSDTLATQAIAFTLEAAAESGESQPRAEFREFGDGEIREHVRWRVDSELEVFESDTRESPEDSNRVPLALASRLFADRGIYVPACCPKSRGPQAWLALWDLEPSRIGRADLFRLRGSSFFEDETLTMDVPEIEEEPEDPSASAATTADQGGGSEQPPAAEPTGGLRGLLQRFFPGRD